MSHSSPHSSFYFTLPLPSCQSLQPKPNNNNNNNATAAAANHNNSSDSQKQSYLEVKLPWILPVRVCDGAFNNSTKGMLKSGGNSLSSLKVLSRGNVGNLLTSNGSDVANSSPNYAWPSGTYSSAQTAVNMSIYALQQQQQLLLQESHHNNQIHQNNETSARKTVPIPFRNTPVQYQICNNNHNNNNESSPSTTTTTTTASRLPSISLGSTGASSGLDATSATLPRPWMRPHLIRPIPSAISVHTDSHRYNRGDNFGSIQQNGLSDTSNDFIDLNIPNDQSNSYITRKRYSDTIKMPINTSRGVYLNKDTFPYVEPLPGANYQILQRINEICNLEMETVRWEKTKLFRRSNIRGRT